MNEEIGHPMPSSLLAKGGENRITPDEEVILRHLQHSQLQNALVRHKAQRFLALRALGRSVELRRQLSHAQTAASSAAGGVARPTAPPLDPSVKALIEKLTDIAEILPGYCGDQQLGQPIQRTLYGGGEPKNEQQRAAAGYPSRAHATEGNASLVASTTATETPASESEMTGHLGDDTHTGEGHRSRMGGGEIEAAVEGSQDPSAQLNEEYMNPAEEEEDGDVILGQQLRELDSNMNTMFQDFEKKVIQKDGGKDPEFSKEQEEEKKQEDENRQKERAALLVQLEELSGGGLTRRPKWRWIEEGIDDPHPDRVLKGKHLWKAATMLIIVFYVRPRRALMQRKARSKDRDTQDWNTTLTIYFDRCQTWLLKTARIPVGNSLLKNNTLNFRLNRVDGKKDAYGAAVPGGAKARGGFVSALVSKVARGMSHENLALTLMRLKVHAKGVMNGLTQEMPPSDIMTFFSYLAADGNYFPEGFFFEEEKEVLSFDELGAVRYLTPSTDAPDALDDTLYALHASKELEEELGADNQGHHEGFLDAHHLGWLVDAGHTLIEGTKAGIAGYAAAAVDRPTDLRAAVLHGRDRLPGKFKSVYRHEANNQWFDTSFVEMILTNYLMVRLLIPWILLYPQESGLVPSSGLKPSLLTHNCQVMASTVYLIVRVLRPELTAPNADTINAAIAEETERAAKIAAGEEGGDDAGNKGDGDDDDDHDDDSSDNTDSEEESARGGRNKNLSATEGAAEDPKAEQDGSNEKNAGPRKKLGALRRGSRAAAARIRPRTVPEIMQQKRYVSISDKQLIPGLLPDAYFLPFAEQMRPWVLTLAAELDSWMQKVVAVVMGKVESSAIRQERAPKKGEQGD